MEPGIYNNISNEHYHASSGISRSGILRFRTSPLHYWHEYIANSKEDSEKNQAMMLGTAFHELVLEPKVFEKKYLIIPKIDKRTKQGKSDWDQINETNKFLKRTLIQDDLFEPLERMSMSLISHPEAKALIADAVYENSIYWNDPFTGVLCKSRPDIMHPHMIVDIKTTDDAHPDAFRFSVRKYGYHVQAAMLLDGMNNIKGTNCNNFIIIAVEKKPPYAVAVYVLDEAAIDVGREIYKSTLVDYKKCLDKNMWPSYATQTISI